MKYIELVNQLICKTVADAEYPLLYGQNLAAGSCIGGLTRGLKVKSTGRIWNSTNAENSLVGLGFGLMMNGAQAGFFMKQMDFLLLGIDQLVNTYNIIRSIKHQDPKGSFTIVSTVVDSGFEGPQSSLNNFQDFCSIARIPGFTVTNKFDAEYLIPKHLMQPGFRILGVSQRLGKTEVIDPGSGAIILSDGAMFKYSEGDDATLVSFNFSCPQTLEFNKRLREQGIHTTHFNVNSARAVPWNHIIESVRKTKKIVVVDDSKSCHVAADNLLAELCGNVEIKTKVILKRDIGDDWLHPRSDVFTIDDGIAELLR